MRGGALWAPLILQKASRSVELYIFFSRLSMQWPCIDDFRFLNQLSGCNGGYRSLVPARVAFDGDVVINDLRVPPPPQEVRCGSYRYEKWAFGRMVWNLDKEQNSQRQIVVLFPDWICEATGEISQSNIQIEDLSLDHVPS
jgi:hypothetical protein